MIASTLVLGSICSVYTRQKRKKKKKKKTSAACIIQKRWRHIRERIRAVHRLQNTWRCHRAHVVSTRAVHAAHNAAIQALATSAIISCNLYMRDGSPYSTGDSYTSYTPYSTGDSDDSYDSYETAEEPFEIHFTHGLRLFKRAHR